MEIQTKKIIALTLVGAYVLLTTYSLVANKTVPEGYVGMISMVLGFYFGRTNLGTK